MQSRQVHACKVPFWRALFASYTHTHAHRHTHTHTHFCMGYAYGGHQHQSLALLQSSLHSSVLIDCLPFCSAVSSSVALNAKCSTRIFIFMLDERGAVQSECKWNELKEQDMYLQGQSSLRTERFALGIIVCIFIEIFNNSKVGFKVWLS